MGKREKINFGSDHTEKIFISLTIASGFLVEPPISIHCLTPVLDKNGLPKKTITTPDCLVKEPDGKREILVEVTKGAGGWESKQAQLRVIEQASLEKGVLIPYCVVTGVHIAELQQINENLEIRKYLLALFGWAIIRA